MNNNEENLFTNLLIEFDEMGFCPTTLCKDPEQEAIEWKKNLIKSVDEEKKETLKDFAEILINLFADEYTYTNKDIENVIKDVLGTNFGVKLKR